MKENLDFKSAEKVNIVVRKNGKIIEENQTSNKKQIGDFKIKFDGSSYLRVEY